MASSDVVLSAALRNNLLSLQATQRSIDTTQLRLATGKKVNSALDNPSNFFTSQALTNRSSDLTRLLDSINLSLRTIEETDKGLTSLQSLVQQAQSIAESARDELAANVAGARMVGTVDLSGVSSLTTATFTAAGVSAGDQFVITTTDDAGTRITNSFTLVNGESVAALMARITDVYADTRNGEIIASLTDEGFIDIQSKDGRSFKIADNVGTGTARLTVPGWTALGLGKYFEDEQRGLATSTFSSATIVGGNELFSMSIYESAGGSNLADRGDLLSQTTYYDVNGTAIISNLSTNTTFNFVVNASAATSTTAVALTATTSWQDLVEQVNQDTRVNTLIQANFDDATGRFSITSISDTTENVQLSVGQTAIGGTFDIGLGDPTGNLNPIFVNNAAAGTYQQVFGFNSSTEVLDNLANDYNTVRQQIDDLVNDANYRGVNLLNGDVLTTYFNEDNTSLLETTGQILTSAGLGITEATFRTSTGIENDLDKVASALADVRSFGNTIANSLTIIQTRKDFTEQTIVTLKAGAADLTLADQNEEGANLLALQTRQQLGVTSLALASQSQQSVLRLF